MRHEHQRSALVAGGPKSFRDAVTEALSDVGFSIAGDFSDSDCAVVYCGSDASWQEVEQLARVGRPVVAILTEMRLTEYTRALRTGAGAAHQDVDTEVIVRVLEAAIRGETLVPIGVAELLASGAGRPVSTARFDSVEIEILRLLVAGETNSQIARTVHFHERTVRRRLQSIGLKLGATNRAQIIVRATELDLSEHSEST